MRLKRLAFWLGVAGVAVIAPAALNIAADKIPSRGLKRFRDFVTNTPRGT